MTIAPAGAGRYWCRADPIIAFNGTPVQVWVEMPEEYQYLVNGPIRFEVTTPGWVESEVLFTDEGFNGYGETIEFSTNRDAWESSSRGIGQTESYSGIGVNSPSTFTVAFDVSVPLDERQLRRDFRTRSNSIPLRLRIVDANGTEQVVAGTVDRTQISVVVSGSETPSPAE